MTDREMLEKAREFARDISRNYDCDNDAHRYGTSCRCCDAEELLGAIAAHLAATASPTGPAEERDDDGPLSFSGSPALMAWAEVHDANQWRVCDLLRRADEAYQPEAGTAADALEALAEAGRG